MKKLIYAILPTKEQGNPRLVSKLWNAESSLEFVKEQQELLKSMTKNVAGNLDPSKYPKVIDAFQEMVKKNSRQNDLFMVSNRFKICVA